MQCQYCGDSLDTSEMQKVYRSSAFEDDLSGLVHVTEIVEQGGTCQRCGSTTVLQETAEREVDIDAYEYL